MLSLSRNREQLVGYKLSMVPFSEGSPVAASDNKTAAMDIMTNADISKCPDDCFRPVGLALDSQGRLFMSSDSTGEIYMIQKGEPNSMTGGSASSSSATHIAWNQNLGVIWLVGMMAYYFLS